MQTHEVNRLAVGDRAKQVREHLKRLGMRRCSLALVYYQCVERDLRLDWYGCFWRWFRALWHARREGAELLYEDFRARVEALRAGDAPEGGDWYEQVARCEGEHSEALREAILVRDPARIRKELADDIREKRRLLAMTPPAPVARSAHRAA